MSHRALVVILDGLGDRPVAALDGRTPLDSAETPFMDQLAAVGTCGLTQPLAPDLAVDTPTGTALLLGVPRAEVEELARGPVEAAGVGLDVEPGDVAIRCNFATLENGVGGLVIRDRRAGRIREGTEALALALASVPLGNGITATVRPASQHRAVLRLSGPGLSARISDTDPGGGEIGSIVLPCEPLDPGDTDARRTADALNHFLARGHEVLQHHPVNDARRSRGEPPANGVITRGAGVVTNLESTLRRKGLRTTIVAGERTVIGLGRLLGFHIRSDPRFTGLPDTDVAAKVSAAQTALEDSDVVFLHIKGPDVCAHDRDPGAKRALFERTDRALSQLSRDGLIIAICGDHGTDSNTGDHIGDPVPALLSGDGVQPDAVERFHEAACADGALGRLATSEFLQRCLDALRTT